MRAAQRMPADIRAEWLALLARYRRDPDRPMNDRYWSSLDTLSGDELQDVLSTKLRLAVQYAYETIPFYRRKFDGVGLRPGDIRGLEDLQRIPVTTKHQMAEDVAAHPPWGSFTAVDDDMWKARGWQLFATSGTTSAPRLFRYTAFDRDMWAWTDARALWAMRIRPGRDSALIASGYGPHVWLWGLHYAFNLMGIPIITAGNMEGRMRAHFVDRYKPTILACTVTYALHLGLVMQEIGLDPARTSIRFLVCAGEPGFSIPATRRRLESLWNAELHEFYGTTEAAPSAGGYTCSEVAKEKDRTVTTHLMADTHIWETVDPATLAPVPEGERGVTVVTNLCSEASPQLRFLVGDYTQLTTGPCACGRTGPRAIGGFAGRADDMLKIRGVSLFPSTIEDAVRQFDDLGDEFEIVVTKQRELDRLLVRVETRGAMVGDRLSAMAHELEAALSARCLIRAEIELVAPGTLPRTEFKARRVKDLR